MSLAWRIALLSLAPALLVWPRTVGSAEAPPRVMMLYEGGLPEPVLITERSDIEAFLAVTYSHAASVSEVELQRRPFIRVAFFWGLETLNRPDELRRTLRPEKAGVHSRLYPAHEGSAAVLIWPFSFHRVGPRAVTREAAGILLKYDVDVTR